MSRRPENLWTWQETQTRHRLWRLLPTVGVQWLLGAVLLGGAAVSAGVGQPVTPGLGTLADRPLPAAADPAAVGLVGRAHGCVPVAVWRNTHNAGTLPGWVLMTSGVRVRVVETPEAFALARAGWLTEGWCQR